MNNILENTSAELKLLLQNYKELEADKIELENQLGEISKAIIEFDPAAGLGVKESNGGILVGILQKISKQITDLKQKDHAWKGKENEHTLIIQLLNSEKAELSRKLTQSLQDLASCREELRIANSNQISQNQKEVNIPLKEKEQLASKVELLEKQLETIKEENRKLNFQAQSIEAREKLAGLNEKNVQALEQQLKSKEEEVAKLKASLESSNNQLKISTRIFEEAESALKASNKVNTLQRNFI